MSPCVFSLYFLHYITVVYCNGLTVIEPAEFAGTYRRNNRYIYKLEDIYLLQ